MITITVYDATVGDEVLAEGAAAYREVYAEPPYLEGETDFVSFADDLARRVKSTSFRLVIARMDNDVLGFGLGHQLSPDTRWWEGSSPAMPTELTAEPEGRTFAVIELAVRRRWRQKGLGRQLHAHLTVGLTEERLALLVRPDAGPDQAAYRSWGYQRVGALRPYPSAPTYDAMIRLLH